MERRHLTLLALLSDHQPFFLTQLGRILFSMAGSQPQLAEQKLAMREPAIRQHKTPLYLQGGFKLRYMELRLET
jgi:hypothetical protein